MDENPRNAEDPLKGRVQKPPEAAEAKGLCCHLDKKNGRNLVVSIDGTSNKFGAMNTNVIEHHSLLEDEHQVLYYNSGIGTYARPSWTSPKFIGMVLHHKIDLAIAWDFDKTVMDAYRWISDNYESSDLIFLFGFSRGAFQVRVLSAMIKKVGLLRRGNELQIPFAYELYLDPATDELEPMEPQRSSPRGRERVTIAERFKRMFSRKGPGVEDSATNDPERLTIAERFKSTFSRKDVKVHFVGVWDTVSSIGIVRGAKMLPGTIDGMEHVCFFRHALALDERRVKFLPEYANGGKRPDEKATSGRIPHTKEVWFAGTHSDIGGGNTINATLNRSRPPLRWMVYEAGPLGLRMSQFKRNLEDEEEVLVKESLSWVWWPFEYFPFRRLTYTRQEEGKETTHSLHRGKVRKIQPGQKIHVSVVSSESYSPKASAPTTSQGGDDDFWKALGLGDQRGTSKKADLYDQWVEQDMLYHINNAIDSLKQPGNTLDGIKQFLRGDEAQHVFYEAVMTRLDNNSGLDQDGKDCLMKESLQVLGSTRFKFQLIPVKEVRKRIGNPRIDDRAFLDRFSQIFQTYPKLDSVTFSVAFSPDGKWLASGHGDGTVRTWDLTSGAQTVKDLGQHSQHVMSVAFSPNSKHLVSGSWDDTIRLWDIEKMEQVGDPWKGHTAVVRCVTFSPDGKKVVSASDDETLRLWDPEIGKEIAVLKGHEDIILSVAFSPDGLHIASGSDDCTVRIWDARTYQQVGEPLKGHTYSIWSVAYSPNGKQIASGSWDDTIRLWDADTMVQVGEPLKGHSDYIRSVCFSPNGKLLASGSDDCTIRIWNANTGAQIGEGLCGHSSYVLSVAFSPDGKQLASASLDRTIRIWDVESYVHLHSIG
ncbi:hypothetical protein D9613_011524 [Agrocybe pediades]|uniref:T6SS Phospholipase effector Tle1-like catalytic domain-containing protein n=1 Tax=Agrocybe pediades TaxID=84607 RepID=A0A8H4QW46_9AGAR|nr:hypothetical protein D9613_011524 [Agrocybe pediades]